MTPLRRRGFQFAPAALFLAVALPVLAVSPSRPPAPMDAAQIRLELAKLRVTGTALYVAAHPDDENTALLAWWAKETKVRAGYLSITRGDGGQNLIGSEAGAELGVIRTEELLAARRIDGAEQFFTRASDFGYSKNPEETFGVWGKEAILADVVRVIRTFRPDVIVTRFPTTGEGGHGHHTASAILAGEAFAAAGDPKRFPGQLSELKPWSPKRIFWNAWRRDAGEAPPATAKVMVDLGVFSPLLGRAMTEIAAESRSQHKSQGFGSAERRGPVPNDFELVGGEPAAEGMFDGIDLSWNRFPAGEAVDLILADAEAKFRPESPWGIVPALLAADEEMAKRAGDPLVDAKRRDLAEVVRAAAGLWFEAIAAEPSAVVGRDVRVALAALNRSPIPFVLEGVDLPALSPAPPPPPAPPARPSRWNPPRDPSPQRPERVALMPNSPVHWDTAIRLPAGTPASGPHWLDPASRRFAGLAENAPVATATFRLRLGESRIAFEVPVLHRSTDPVVGERYRPLEAVPPATLRFEEKVLLFPGAAGRDVAIVVEAAGGPAVTGTVRPIAPAGWTVEPASREVTVPGGKSATVAFRVVPGGSVASPSASVLAAEIRVGERTDRLGRVVVDYPHIPVRSLFPPAEAKLVRLDVAIAPGRIGYVAGSGDDGAAALRRLGYEVELLGDDELAGGDLSRFTAIVGGVRAANTRDRLRSIAPRLHEWAKGGGTLLWQYVTAEEGLGGALAPDSMTITRDRVTVEGAPVVFALPAHPVLTAPNRIAPRDFDGWVQERGLYFAGGFAAPWEAPLSMADPGEESKGGSLIVAPHGKGRVIYTGLALFRQLPAGVPGAYRLLANLVAPATPAARK